MGDSIAIILHLGIFGIPFLVVGGIERIGKELGRIGIFPKSWQPTAWQQSIVGQVGQVRLLIANSTGGTAP